jgi:hypothetical protein
MTIKSPYLLIFLKSTVLGFIPGQFLCRSKVYLASTRWCVKHHPTKNDNLSIQKLITTQSVRGNDGYRPLILYIVEQFIIVVLCVNVF